MQLVVRGWDWIFTAVGKEHNCVGNPDCPCAGDVTFVISVMLHSWPNVESVGTMGIPRFSLLRRIVYNDLTPSWGHRRFVVVEHAMNLAVCAEFGVIPGFAK